jgi:acyl-CoA thioesterase I
MPLRQLSRVAKLLASISATLITLAILLGTVPAPQLVVFLGDSITAGHGVELSQAYPALIQEKIDAKRWPFKVVNAGQSGDTSAGGLSRIDWLLRNRIDVLVIELGGNDGLRGLPAESTRKNLQSIIDRVKAKYPNAKFVIAGMKVPPNMGRDYAGKFQAIFPSLAKTNHAALIPFILEGVGGVSELNLPDGIHPTARGHQVVAANVWKVLEPVLRSLTK